jgi:hypothetical protein
MFFAYAKSEEHRTTGKITVLSNLILRIFGKHLDGILTIFQVNNKNIFVF